MIDFNDIIIEFEEYLYSSGIYTKGTSECYAKNYVKSAVENILTPWFEQNKIANPFMKFDTNDTKSNERSLISAVSDIIISNEIKNQHCMYSSKTISNWRSGVRAFFTFLENQKYNFYVNTNTSSLNAKIQQSCTSVVYSNKDLFKTFKARLVTQDRVYRNMIYPARLINSVLNGSTLKKEYGELLTEVINNTKFLIDNSSEHKCLCDVSTLVIDYSLKKGNAIIEGKCDSWFIFTENPKSNCNEKIVVKGLEDLSLDHDKPLQNILDNAKAQTDYPALKRLSDLYATTVNNSPVSGNYLKVSKIRNFKDYSSKCYIDNKVNFTKSFVAELLNDLIKLYANIGFTIMLRNYNSSKGKGKP